MWASVALAIDRYDALKNPLSRKITLGRAIAISAATWLLPLTICIPGVIGWGYVVHTRQETDVSISDKVQCYIDPVKSFGFVVFWSISAAVTPAVMIVFFYCLLMRIIWKKSLTRRALMYVKPLAGSLTPANNRLNEIEAQAFRISFIIILSNFVFISPFVVLLLLKLDVHRKGVAEAHMVTILLLDINIVINSFLYTFGVGSFRLVLASLCHCNEQNANNQHSPRPPMPRSSTVLTTSFGNQDQKA
jgi:hypothetical protein